MARWKLIFCPESNVSHLYLPHFREFVLLFGLNFTQKFLSWAWQKQFLSFQQNIYTIKTIIDQWKLYFSSWANIFIIWFHSRYFWLDPDVSPTFPSDKSNSCYYWSLYSTLLLSTDSNYGINDPAISLSFIFLILATLLKCFQTFS